MKQVLTTGVIALVVGLAVGYGISYTQYNSIIEKVRVFYPPIPDFNSISGTIKEVKNDIIVLETFPQPNPFEELPNLREIIVEDQTKIVKRERVKELIQEQEIKITELRAGDQIFVEAASSIKTRKRFKAVKIILQGAGAILPQNSLVSPPTTHTDTPLDKPLP